MRGNRLFEGVPKSIQLRCKSRRNTISATALIEATINTKGVLRTAIHVPTTSTSQLIHLPSRCHLTITAYQPTTLCILKSPQVAYTAQTFRWSYHGKVHLLPPHPGLIGRPELRCQWTRQMQVECGARVINIQLHKNDFGPEKTAGSI